MFGNSLGPVQFAWLEKTLIASAKLGKKCLILSHTSFHKDISGGTPDTPGVQQLVARVNAMKKGTITMVLNGHYHANRMFEENGIVYFDINTTRNIWWQLQKEPHYVDGQGQMVEQSFTFEVVDKDGNMTTFDITTDKATVGEALLEEGLIKGEVGQYGLYVTEVNGIVADYNVDQTYWAFYVDGAYASSGVDTTDVVDGSTYSFKVEK